MTLNDRPGEPMTLAVLPDGRVLHSARTGEIRIYNPKTGLNTMAADMRDGPAGLYQHDEEGVQGVALDPKFAQNKWVYVYYSPKLNTPVDVPGTGINEGDAPFNLETPEDRARLALFKGAIRLSRFKFEGSKLDLGTEQKIIDVPVDRGICCHVGGKIDFDGEGNLFLSTGDDTNPFESDGYSPIDERSNRNPAFDAQRTSANTNDLRGKILRIRVTDGRRLQRPGGEPVPAGHGADEARDLRHGLPQPVPHGGRQEVEQRLRGRLLAGRQRGRSDARGPQGIGRWMLVDRPGNYGWPYCMTRTIGYVDYDFATEESGEEFPCPNPVNESPNNTGRRVLPEIVQPDVYYSYPENDFGLFPELFEDRGGDGIGPMGGPAYDFHAEQPLRDQVAERVRRPPAVLRVDARLLQGVRAQPQERQPARSTSTTCSRAARAGSSRTTRWTRSSARTARSTRSSTATGSSSRPRRRSSAASTSCAATSSRRSRR